MYSCAYCSVFQMQNQQLTNMIADRDKYATKLGEKLYEFTQTGDFSDICIISADDVKFYLHKCIISAFSDYFNAMFGSQLIESKSPEVKIHDISSNILEPIIRFMYTGNIDLDGDIVEDILKAANFFQIEPLISECHEFMGEKLDDTNCLEVILFADQQCFPQLCKKATIYASGIFDIICKDKLFLELDEIQLGRILSSYSLRVTSEEVIFDSLIEWVEHDKENRESCAYDLFMKVRFWLLSLEFIRENRCKLPSRIEILEMVCTWLEWHSLPDGERPIKSMKYAKPISTHGLAIVGGGSIQTYDAEWNVWTSEYYPSLPYRFDKVLTYKNKLIFSWIEKPLISFDISTQESVVLPRCNVKRRNFGWAIIKNDLYIVGGQKYLMPWKRNVEKYSFTTGKWMDVQPTNTTFVEPKVAAVDGKLYVIGDKSPIMECFNPGTNQWTTRHISQFCNSSFGFTEVNGSLFKIGGVDYLPDRIFRDKFFRNVQSYDPIKNTWSAQGALKKGLVDPHCVSWNNRLYICGGKDETGKHLNLVQEYNPNTNEWEPLAELVQYKYTYGYGLVAFK